MLGDAEERRLHGVHVMVVEDDHVQSDGIVGCLTDFGATIVGPAHSLSEAHQLVASNSIHIAIVDIDLGDGASFDLAQMLQSQNLPFIFATGYNCRKIPPDFGHIKCLEKPFTEHALVSSVVEAVSDTRH